MCNVIIERNTEATGMTNNNLGIWHIIEKIALPITLPIAAYIYGHATDEAKLVELYFKSLSNGNHVERSIAITTLNRAVPHFTTQFSTIIQAEEKRQLQLIAGMLFDEFDDINNLGEAIGEEWIRLSTDEKLSTETRRNDLKQLLARVLEFKEMITPTQLKELGILNKELEKDNNGTFTSELHLVATGKGCGSFLARRAVYGLNNAIAEWKAIKDSAEELRRYRKEPQKMDLEKLIQFQIELNRRVNSKEQPPSLFRYAEDLSTRLQNYRSVPSLLPR